MPATFTATERRQRDKASHRRPAVEQRGGGGLLFGIKDFCLLARDPVREIFEESLLGKFGVTTVFLDACPYRHGGELSGKGDEILLGIGCPGGNGRGKDLSKYRKDETVFAQGDPSNAVFSIREGECKVTVVSEQGKEAVVAIHGKGDFFGEGCLNGHTRRLATVVTITACEIMRLEKAAMVRVLHDQPEFSELFISHWWLVMCGLKRTWSISFSIPARSVWRGCFC